MDSQAVECKQATRVFVRVRFHEWNETVFIPSGFESDDFARPVPAIVEVIELSGAEHPDRSLLVIKKRGQMHMVTPLTVRIARMLSRIGALGWRRSCPWCEYWVVFDEMAGLTPGIIRFDHRHSVPATPTVPDLKWLLLGEQAILVFIVWVSANGAAKASLTIMSLLRTDR